MNGIFVKRIFAAALSLTLLLPAAALAVTTETDGIGVSALSDYDTAFEFLSSMNMLPDFYGRDTGAVTRAEFAAMTVRIMGIGSAGENAFPDVDEKHPYYKELCAAAAAGIISGNGVNFLPDEPISYYDAAAIAVLALGYSKNAEIRGGYPKGYVDMASRLKIISAAQFTGEDGGLPPAEAMVIAYDMLHAERDEIMVNGESLLDSMKLTEIGGTVYGADGESFVDSLKDADRINIGGERYKLAVSENAISLDEYLGCNVEAWIDENGDIAAIARTRRNEILTVPLREYTVTFENGYLLQKEKDGDKTKRYKISSKCLSGKNGRAKDILNDSMPESGYLRLTDANGDGTYDTVMLYEPRYIFVSALNFVGNMVYDENKGEALNFDNDSIVRAFLDTGGGLEKASWEDILAGDAVEVYQSDDGGFVRIIISRSTVSGVVESMDVEELTINGAEYKINSYFAEYYISRIRVGSSVTMAVSPDGTLTAVSQTGGNAVAYGYLVRAYKDEENDRQMATILGQDNKQRKYILADKVTLDGEKTSSKGMLVEEALYRTEPETGKRYTRYQLLRYNTNARGELNMIDTADNSYDQKHLSDSNGNLNYALRKLYPEKSEANDSLKQMVTQGEIDYGSNGQAAPFFVFGGNTQIFAVPAELKTNPYKSYDIEDFAVYTKGFDNEFGYTVDAYDYNSGYEPAAVVVYDTTVNGGEPHYAATPYMVCKVVRTVNENNAETVKIKVYDGKSYYEYLVSEKSYDTISRSGSIPNKGDIVRISVNADGCIDGIGIDFSYDKNKGELTQISGRTNINSSRSYQYGRVYDVKGSTILLYNKNMQIAYGPANSVNITSPAFGIYAFKVVNQEVIMYNLSDDEIRSARFDDVPTIMNSGDDSTSRAVICSSSGRGITAFVYCE